MNNRGFTLIELLISVALLATFLVAAFFVFDRWTERNEIETIVRTFENTLAFAREMAMTSHTTIEVCPLSDDQKCGESWEKGQLVLDVPTQKVVRVIEAIPSGFTVLWRPTLQTLPLVQFRTDGFVANGLQGSFYVCAASTHTASARIVLLRTGRTRSVTGQFPECK